MTKRIKALILSVVMVLSMLAPLSAFADEMPSGLDKILIIYNMNHKTNNSKTYYPIHIYSGIDSLNYREVGFDVTVSNSNTEQSISKATTVVYTAMNVMNSSGTITKYTAQQLSGNYMFGQELLFAAGKWFNEDTVIEVTPYALKTDGSKIPGKTITVSDEILKQNNPDSRLFKEVTQDEDEKEDGSVIASGSTDVTVTEDNKVSGDGVTITADTVSAEVPGGVALQDGATELTLSLSELNESASGVETGDTEVLSAYDVHIDGVAENNDVPITVTINDVVQNGLNNGNISVYHVEDGNTVEMERVASLDELTGHNQFAYEPSDGTLTLSLANFSEVAFVADTTKAWEGNYDYSWYAADATELTIANADQLAAFGAIVGGMVPEDEEIDQDSFKDKTITLLSDINLDDDEENNDEALIFYPIGYYNNYNSYERPGEITDAVESSVSSFEGTFDGNGHTIANFYQNTWEMFGDYNSGYNGTPNYYKDAMGLFGYVYGGTVKNLTIDNFSSDGEFTPTGCVAAYAVNSTFENIALIDCNPRVYNTGNGGIVGIGGNSDDPDTYELTFTNITIDNTNKISALWGSWDVACGGLVGMFRGAGSVDMTNCHVAAQIDVYNDVCGNYQYYWYRYAGMLVGTNKNMTTDANGYTVPETEKFHAENCTVHFGEWNDYYYCELVANSLASYTHDHQFSRLTQVDSVDVTAMTYTVDGVKTNIPTSGRYNYVVVNGTASTENATCYHFVDGAVWNHEDAGKETVDNVEVLKEDKQHIYLPFNQLFTGYGWGVKHIPVYNGEDYAFEGVTILDREVANSVEKFAAVADNTAYTTGTTVSVGDLFSEISDLDSKVAVQDANVKVFVSPVGETSTAGGTYTANTTDWTQGTLTFTGVGAATVTITDYYYCTPTVINVTIEPIDKFESKFTGDFLYRVGNQNTVSLSSLFEAVDETKLPINNSGVYVTIDKVDENSNVGGTYTANTSDWKNGTIKFSGTGPVKVTIQDYEYCTPTELYLEVVDATNVTEYSELKNQNSVLLNDITMSDGGSYYLSSATLYGNGFTFDVTDGAYTGKNISSNYLVYLNNANLDNVNLVGAVYTSYGAGATDAYNRSVVLSDGNNTISNSCISNCAAPVRVRSGNLEIIDSTLKGGNFANIDIRGGYVVLDNVTTINQVNGNDTAADGTVVVGLGVVIYYEGVSNTTTIEIKNGITQYNHLSETQANTYIQDENASQLVASMFGEDYSAVQYNDNSDIWVNTGILSMTEEIDNDNITNVDDYLNAYPTFLGKTGYLHTKKPDATSIKAPVPEYITAGQYAITPSYSFDYTTKNYVAKSDGSNDYCFEENGVVNISMDEGDTFNWDTSILTLGKGITNYTVSMDGTDYTGKSITFDTAGNYDVVYTYTDPNNYKLDGNGDITTYPKEYTKTVRINVSVVAPDIKNAEVNITKTSLDGVYTTVNLTDYKLRVNFLDCISVTDYDETGTGTMVDLTSDISSATLTPASVNVFTTASTITITYTDGRVLTVNLSKISGSSAGTKTATVNISGDIYFITDGALNNKPTEESNQNICTITSVSFKGNNGAIVTNDTDVTVTWALESSSSSSECITADTLVTLADGTQKEVQYLTGDEELLVWNLETGSYDSAPIVFVDSDKENEYEIVHLYFSDGTDVEVIYEHGFFDLDTGEYVYLDKNNAADYIGHSFVQQKDIESNTWNSVELSDVVIEKKVTKAYSPVTFEHLCYYVDGMLSMPGGIDGLFNIFDVNTSTMKYDAEKMAKDIEEYGLFTYADFESLIPEIAYEAFNGDILKVAIGKGMLTWEDIEYLAERYMPLISNN